MTSEDALALAILTDLVRRDERGVFPAAERELRRLLGDPYHPSSSAKSQTFPFYRPHASDPEGLVRSLRSRRTPTSGGAASVSSRSSSYR